MYIIIVDTKEDWGHYTVIKGEDDYPMDFPDFNSAEQWFIHSRLSDHFSVRYVNMED